jgi:hypothetical protein
MCVLFVIVICEKKVEEHCVKMWGHIEGRSAGAVWVLYVIRWSYCVNIKIMVINDIKETNKLQCSKKVQCCRSKYLKVEGTKTEYNKCKLHLEIFQLPTACLFLRIRKGNCWVCILKRKTGMLIMWETKYKAQELARSHCMQSFWQDSTSLCMCMMLRNGFSLRRRTLFCQKLPADSEEKIAACQQHVVVLKTKWIAWWAN